MTSFMTEQMNYIINTNIRLLFPSSKTNRYIYHMLTCIHPAGFLFTAPPCWLSGWRPSAVPTGLLASARPCVRLISLRTATTAAGRRSCSTRTLCRRSWCTEMQRYGFRSLLSILIFYFKQPDINKQVDMCVSVPGSEPACCGGGGGFYLSITLLDNPILNLLPLPSLPIISLDLFQFEHVYFAKYDAVELYLRRRAYPPGLNYVEKNTFRRFCKKFVIKGSYIFTHTEKGIVPVGCGGLTRSPVTWFPRRQAPHVER